MLAISSCTSRNRLTIDLIEKKANQCDEIVVAVGQTKKVVLSEDDSLFMGIISSLKKDCYRGVYNDNERSRKMFKMYLLHADVTILDLTVLDNEVGALVYKGDWLLGQDVMIYDSLLIKTIREAFKRE